VLAAGAVAPAMEAVQEVELAKLMEAVKDMQRVHGVKLVKCQRGSRGWGW